MRTFFLILICFFVSNRSFGQELNVGAYYHFGENVLPFGKVDSDAYPTYFEISYDHFIGKKYFIKAGFAAWAFDEYNFQNYENKESSFGIRLGFGGTVYKVWNDKIHLNWLLSGRNYEAKNFRTSLFYNDVFTEKKYKGATIQFSPIVRWEFHPNWNLSIQSYLSLLDIRKTNSKYFTNQQVVTESNEELRFLRFPSDFLVGISVGYLFKVR